MQPVESRERKDFQPVYLSLEVYILRHTTMEIILRFVYTKMWVTDLKKICQYF